MPRRSTVHASKLTKLLTEDQLSVVLAAIAAILSEV